MIIPGRNNTIIVDSTQIVRFFGNYIKLYLTINTIKQINTYILKISVNTYYISEFTLSNYLIFFITTGVIILTVAVLVIYNTILELRENIEKARREQDLKNKKPKNDSDDEDNSRIKLEIPKIKYNIIPKSGDKDNNFLKKEINKRFSKEQKSKLYKLC